jgi:hypothetical protein
VYERTNWLKPAHVTGILHENLRNVFCCRHKIAIVALSLNEIMTGY